MTLTEPVRTSIALKLTDCLGSEEASALMAHIPTYDIGQLVTVELLDLRLGQTESKLQKDMADLRAELKGDMADLRAELKGDMADLRAELKGDMADLRAELTGLEARLDALPRQLLREVLVCSMGLLVANATVFGALQAVLG